MGQQKAEIVNLKLGKVLKGYTRDGHKKVTLPKPSGEKVNLSVHRLVYSAFYGSIKGVIDHIDGNKLNNNLDNLRDVTQSQNMINAQKKGTKDKLQ